MIALDVLERGERVAVRDVDDGAEEGGGEHFRSLQPFSEAAAIPSSQRGV